MLQSLLGGVFAFVRQDATCYAFIMTEKSPTDPADHAQDFAQRWADKLEEHCAIRMHEMGISDDMNGQPDYGGDGRWVVFDPYEREGGRNTTGVIIDSGVLNPDLLKGLKGGRI